MLVWPCLKLILIRDTIIGSMGEGFTGFDCLGCIRHFYLVPLLFACLFVFCYFGLAYYLIDVRCLSSSINCFYICVFVLWKPRVFAEITFFEGVYRNNLSSTLSEWNSSKVCLCRIIPTLRTGCTVQCMFALVILNYKCNLDASFMCPMKLFWHARHGLGHAYME